MQKTDPVAGGKFEVSVQTVLLHRNTGHADHAQHLLVNIHKHRFGLIWGGRRHLPMQSQMRQKRLDAGGSHLLRIPLAVKQDEAPSPVGVRLLRADAAVPSARVVT